MGRDTQTTPLVSSGSHDQRSELILASRSPRRRELLAQIGLKFKVVAVDIDEQRKTHEPAEVYVRRLARLKAQAGYVRTGKSVPVLGADTIVVLDKMILGKPANRDEALSMLENLSGRTHQVLTAVAVLAQGYEATRLSVSQVRFRSISLAERSAYWACGEPVDKAGGYAIQGKAAIFVETLEGSYSGVMGLPLFESAELLSQIGIDLLGGSE